MTIKSFKVVKKIPKKGFPTSSKFYQSAHRAADKIEKKRNPKEYQAMKKVDNKLAKNELAGKNFPSGKIEISAKVPKKYRSLVANNHERVENKKILADEKKSHLRKKSKK